MIKLQVSEIEEFQYELIEAKDNSFDIELSPNDFIDYEKAMQNFYNWQLKIEILYKEKKKK